MTDWQKDQIQTMRRQGLSYVKIGQALGISDNTVRSFCRRNQLGDPVKNTISCQYCGKKYRFSVEELEEIAKAASEKK